MLERYVSLLCIGPDATTTRQTQSTSSSGDWYIVQEVVQEEGSVQNLDADGSPGDDGPSIKSIVAVLWEYLTVERDGGTADEVHARRSCLRRGYLS